jgi:hypothetical protein
MIEDRARTFAFDPAGDQQKEGRENDQPSQGRENIEGALEETIKVMAEGWVVRMNLRLRSDNCLRHVVSPF